MSRRLSSSDPSAVMSRIYRRSTAFRRDAAGAGSGGCVWGEAKLCLCRLALRVGRQHSYRTDGWSVDGGVGSPAEPCHSGQHNVIRPPDRRRHATVTSPAPCVVQSDAHGEGERPEPHEERDVCDCEGGEAPDDRQHRHANNKGDGASDGVADHPVPAELLSFFALHRTLGGVAPDSKRRWDASALPTRRLIRTRALWWSGSFNGTAYVSIATPGVVQVLMRLESTHGPSSCNISGDPRTWTKHQGPSSCIPDGLPGGSPSTPSVIVCAQRSFGCW